jgi:transporter family-2 protein
VLQQLLTFVIGLLGGIAVGIQSPLAGIMGTQVGGASSSLIVHVSGAVLSAALVLARGGENLRDWHKLPPLTLASGVFGVVIFLTLTYTVPRLGAVAAVSLVIVGQLLMGMIIDQFGLFGAAVRPIDLTRLLAVGLLLGGAVLMVRG